MNIFGSIHTGADLPVPRNILRFFGYGGGKALVQNIQTIAGLVILCIEEPIGAVGIIVVMYIGLYGRPVVVRPQTGAPLQGADAGSIALRVPLVGIFEENELCLRDTL